MAGLPWGEVSKWVALLTLTLVGVMEYRGMLRRPVGLLPTPLQRASSTPLGQPGPQFAAGASSAPVTVVSAMERFVARGGDTRYMYVFCKAEPNHVYV